MKITPNYTIVADTEMNSKILFFLLLWVSKLTAQQKLTGTVVVKNGSMKEPLESVKIYWKNAEQQQVFSDSLGRFQIPRNLGNDSLIVSLIGYYSDTLKVGNHTAIEITMEPLAGTEVVIAGRRKASFISTLDPFRTETISSKELTKAACCNLSESFETNPSIDANFTDAVTGTRQIQLLGLSSVYSLVSLENMPYVRGMTSGTGLTHIPGAWVESIQITKGAGNVINGFESTTGQINIELQKPENSLEKGLFNFYTNNMGRTEGNLYFRKKINEQFSTMTLAHASVLPVKWDTNHDHFLDNPIGHQISVMHRVKMQLKNWEGVYWIKGLYDYKQGGQLHYQPSEHVQGTHYGTLKKEQIFEIAAKTGYVFPNKNYKSLGVQTDFLQNENHFDFGRQHYTGAQNTFYFNAIYQTVIMDTRHVLKMGTSLLSDNYLENIFSVKKIRNEHVPGTFAEYTWNPNPRFHGILGLRADYNSILGLFFTPRLHLRYALREKTILRGSLGRGQRTPNFFPENMGLMVSSRRLEVPNINAVVYGLKPEIAWTGGISLQHELEIRHHEASLVIDLYRTEFENQMVIDRESSPLWLKFYNLQGKSFANTFQIVFELEPAERFYVKSAYKFYDVQQTIDGKLREVPFVSKHRGFLNLAYKTENNFKLDFTAQFYGKKRIPDTHQSPLEFQRKTYSPHFFNFIAQISKTWKNKLEIYVGGENLSNFRQIPAIVNHENPFDDYFDATLVWGPVFGAMGYTGLRLKW